MLVVYALLVVVGILFVCTALAVAFVAVVARLERQEED